METFFTLYPPILIALTLHSILWFGISIITKRNDIADIAWGLGFLIVTWMTYGASNNNNIIISILVSIWAIRLSTHIYFRNKTKKEDYRYLAWRNAWGTWFYIRSFFQVFALQGLLLLIIATPIIIANTYTPSEVVGIFGFIGISVWVYGFFWEMIGDWQLSRFIKEKTNKGKLLTTGLWKYSRHPNYFGEVAQWWGIWICTINISYGWVGVIGPLTITFLILKVSGIPLLEKKMQTHPDFDAYRQKTSIFFPLPQKK